jgi:hypothetical protein
MRITPLCIIYIAVVACVRVSHGVPINGVEKTTETDPIPGFDTLTNIVNKWNGIQNSNEETTETDQFPEINPVLDLLLSGTVYDWEVYEDGLKLRPENSKIYELPSDILSAIAEYQDREPETGPGNGSEVPSVLSAESVDPGSRKLVLKEHEKELNNDSPLTLSLDFIMKNAKRKSVLVSTIRLYEFDEYLNKIH